MYVDKYYSTHFSLQMLHIHVTGVVLKYTGSLSHIDTQYLHTESFRQFSKVNSPEEK